MYHGYHFIILINSEVQK